MSKRRESRSLESRTIEQLIVIRKEKEKDFERIWQEMEKTVASAKTNTEKKKIEEASKQKLKDRGEQFFKSEKKIIEDFFAQLEKNENL